MSSVAHHEQPSQSRGRAKACTACRQVKLRCNAKEVAPNPCSRCQAQGITCRMDPAFKRVPARRQLEEVSNRLNDLQRSLGLDHGRTIGRSTAGQEQPLGIAPGFSARSQDNTYPHGRISIASSTPSSEPASNHPTFLNLRSTTEHGSWKLGHVTIESETVQILFRHFDELLFRHCQFIEPVTSLHELHNASPLLFWTIILESCRLYGEYDLLYTDLCFSHRELMSSKIIGDRASLKTVQSLLLMCTWHYPVNHQYDDMTWVLIGAAANMAMQLGLHRPGFAHEYGSPNLRTEKHQGSSYSRKATWLACFQISTAISSWLGLPPQLSSASHLETIELLARDSSLPERLRASAAIQRQVAQAATALDSNLDFRTRCSLVKSFASDLDRLLPLYEGIWCDELEIEWLAAKLFLYGISFVSNNTLSTAQPSGVRIETESPAIGARDILQRALSAAVKILDLICQMRVPATSAGDNLTGLPDYTYQLGFYPKATFRSGAFSAFYLLWFLTLEIQASTSDKELARTYVAATCQLLRTFKTSPEHVRAAESIEMIARSAVSSSKNASLSVNSRLGASFMYSYSINGEHQMKSKVLPTLGVDTVGDQDPPISAGEDLTEASSQFSELESSGEPGYQQQAGPEAKTQVGGQPFGPPMSAPVDATMQDHADMFSNALFQDPSLQNWDFPWTDWDPKVFEGLKMDVNMDDEAGGPTTLG